MNIHALLSSNHDPPPPASPPPDQNHTTTTTTNTNINTNTAAPAPSSKPSAPVRRRRQQQQQQQQQQQPARPARGKRTPSGLSKEITCPPDEVASSSSSSQQQPADAPPPPPPHAFPSPTSSRGSVTGAPSFHPRRPQTPTNDPLLHPAHAYSRVAGASHPSAAQLADWASPPSQPAAYAATNIRQRTPDLVNAPRSPSHAVQQLSISPGSRHAFRQSLADITMAEAPAQPPVARPFQSDSLTPDESKTASELLKYLHENSYAYASHVEFINLLHKGFIAHVYPPVDSAEEELHEPKDYAQFADLKQAREAMDSRFAVGEDIWIDWLSDDMLAAASSDDRIATTELCQKAVQDEPASIRLWQMYADWVSANYAACNNLEGANQSRWTDDDKEVCKELFSQDMVVNVLEQAVAATQWRVDESHVPWIRYAQLVQEAISETPSAEDVERLRNMFVQRLQIPHAAWDETAQMFWLIISKYESSNWEAIMAEVNELATPAKKQMGLRDPHEVSLQRSAQSGDRDAMFAEFEKYLQWEKKHRNRAPFDGELRCALYERALLRFPTNTEWWLDYVDFVTNTKLTTAVLPLIERATRHCPWSGDLWARRILQADVEGSPYDEIEATKHRATNSGLLDVGGMEEMLKVLQQWCSYLRRQAFRHGSTEDDVEIAEVGITMALEDISQVGTKLYGKDFQGDPLLRLEVIQIKFLTQARRVDEARQIYRNLVPTHKNSHEFWTRCYDWEVWLWGFDRMNEPRRVETAENGPNLATAVIQEALSQRHLDWPEKVLELYLNHFQQHESGEKLRASLVEAREFSKAMTTRRAKEAAEAAELAAQQQQYAAATQSEGMPPPGEKRKRDDETFPNGHSDKKARIEGEAGSVGEASSSASALIKRDRENNTISLRNLPSDVQEIDIKKFFRDIGAPVAIGIIQDKDGETVTATVEFESQEDVLAAKTRNGRDLNGREVHIHSGGQSTLYVANYPPELDEAGMRALFDSYGEIASVRFPSLKFNNRRRFCYVQFLTTESAQAAETALDNKMLDGTHRLLAKISDPDAKKQRSGAQAEGRELFVRNLERDAPESEIKTFFSHYGTVVSMNLVKLVNGRRTGTGFIVFASADQASAATAANNKPFRDRILHVEISSPKGRAPPRDRAHKEDMLVKHSASPEPFASASALPPRRGSDVSMASATPAPADPAVPAHARKAALFHLPDTVTDARVRAAMEAHGPLTKVQMRRGIGGAIVEFVDAGAAFLVRGGVDCAVLGEGVRSGDVGELLGSKGRGGEAGRGPGRRGGGAGAGGAASPGAGAGESLGIQPARVARPGQARGGKRGGLGFKRGGGFGGGSAREEGGPSEPGADAGVKSNADFKRMFERGKEAPREEGS